MRYAEYYLQSKTWIAGNPDRDPAGWYQTYQRALNTENDIYMKLSPVASATCSFMCSSIGYAYV